MTNPIAAPRDLWRIALPAYGPSVFTATGIGAITPVVVLHARQLGASVGVAALVIALLGVGQLLSSLPAGSLVARFGERRALIGASAVQAAAMLAALGSREVWQLALAMLGLGGATSVFFLARQAYLTEAVPLALRARALSTLGGVHRIGVFLGPFLGAAAIALGGLRAAYAVGVVTAVCAGLLVLATPDITARQTRPAGSAPGLSLRPSLRAVLADHRRTLLTLGVGMMVISSARASRATLVPLWAEAIGLEAAQTSLVFGIAGAVDMALFYPAGWVMDRFGRVWTAVPTAVILGAGTLALPLSGSFTTLTLAAMVMAVGNGMGSGVVMTLGADASPEVGRAQFLGGWRLMSDLGSTGGPLMISAVTAVASLAAACVALGALTMAGAGWLARWVPPHDPRRKVLAQS